MNDDKLEEGEIIDELEEGEIIDELEEGEIIDEDNDVKYFSQYVQNQNDVNTDIINNIYKVKNKNDMNDIKNPFNREILYYFYDNYNREYRLDKFLDTINIHKKYNQFHPINDSYKISKKLKENFLDNVTKFYDKDIAEVLRFLIDNTTYITYKKFYKSLKKCVKNFLDMINGKQYIILYVDNEDKSNFWVAQLAFDYILKKFPQNLPFDILRNYEDSIYLYGDKAPLFNYVIFDDCSYSGQQLSGNVYVEYELTNPEKSYIIVPYLSTIAHEYINHELYRLKIPFDNLIFDYKVINIRQILQDKGFNDFEISKYIERLLIYLNDYDQGPTNASYDESAVDISFPIYFDHKIADYISTYPKLYTYGIVYDMTNKSYIYNWLIKKCVNDIDKECPPKIYKNRARYIDFNELYNYM